MKRKALRRISPSVTGAEDLPVIKKKNLGEKIINRITYKNIFMFYLCHRFFCTVAVSCCHIIDSIHNFLDLWCHRGLSVKSFKHTVAFADPLHNNNSKAKDSCVGDNFLEANTSRGCFSKREEVAGRENNKSTIYTISCIIVIL